MLHARTVRPFVRFDQRQQSRERHAQATVRDCSGVAHDTNPSARKAPMMSAAYRRSIASAAPKYIASAWTLASIQSVTAGLSAKSRTMDPWSATLKSRETAATFGMAYSFRGVSYGDG